MTYSAVRDGDGSRQDAWKAIGLDIICGSAGALVLVTVILLICDRLIVKSCNDYLVVGLAFGNCMLIRTHYEIAGFAGVIIVILAVALQSSILWMFGPWRVHFSDISLPDFLPGILPQITLQREFVSTMKLFPVLVGCMLFSKILEAHANASVADRCEELKSALQDNDNGKISDLVGVLSEQMNKPWKHMCRMQRKTWNIMQGETGADCMTATKSEPPMRHASFVSVTSVTSNREKVLPALARHISQAKWRNSCSCPRCVTITFRALGASFTNSLILLLACGVMNLAKIVHSPWVQQTYERQQLVLTLCPLLFGATATYALRSNAHSDHIDVYYSGQAAICVFQYSCIYSARSAWDMILPLSAQMIAEVLRRFFGALKIDMADANREWYSSLSRVVDKRFAECRPCFSSCGFQEVSAEDTDDFLPGCEERTEEERRREAAEKIRLAAAGEYAALFATFFVMKLTSSSSTVPIKAPEVGVWKLVIALFFEILTDFVSLKFIENSFDIRPQDIGLQEYIRKNFGNTIMGSLAVPLGQLALLNAPAAALLAWRWSLSESAE